MASVSTRHLKDQLSHYLQRAEGGEKIVVLRSGRPVAALIPLPQLRGRDVDQATRLAELASRGLVTLPKRHSQTPFQAPRVPGRGKTASEMVIEDRR